MAGRGSLATVATFRHRPGAHRDPDEETFLRPTLIFTESGSWSVGGTEVDRTVLVVGSPGETYRVRHDGPSPDDRTWFVEFRAGGDAPPEASRWLERLGEAPFARRCVPVTPALGAIGASIHRELSGWGTASDVAIDLLALELLVEVARMNGDTTRGSRVPPAVRDQLETARRFVDAHLDQPLAVADIASRANLSPYHFARLFKVHTGVSPHRYVVRARMELAARLLRDTPLTVTQVAERCGIGGPGHFAAVFRRPMGVTPSRYRHG